MDRGHKVTLGPKVEAVGAEVGIEMLDTAEVGIEMFGTAPQVETDGREIFLRADGETSMGSRALASPALESWHTPRLGFHLSLLPIGKIHMGANR